MIPKGVMELLMLLPPSALYFLIQEKFVECNRSEGESMQPTIPNQSTLLIDRFFYKIRGLRKGDIVISKSPVKPDIEICKRITHLENEYVMGIKVPINHVWLEGDNPPQSFDSRQHGPVPINLIKGKIIFSIYPFGPLQVDPQFLQ